VLEAQRSRIQPGTKSWDKGWLMVFWGLMLATPIGAGLEYRNQGSPLRWPFSVLGVFLLAIGLALSARAMAVNPFFEGTVGIQTDRRQRVIEVGPYASIRHPGYVGLALWAVSAPFILQSKRALLLAVVTCGWLIVRTILEDRTLQRELPGYAEYPRRTRFRWIPQVW
jgi:protein-S-isoprenylcysteine O-methyltransferase Ste14